MEIGNSKWVFSKTENWIMSFENWDMKTELSLNQTGPKSFSRSMWDLKEESSWDKDSLKKIIKLHMDL